MPDFTSGGAVEMGDLRHPLLTDPVPNSLTLRTGQGMLVTGSNMSGKSTFLRTVGVNAVLAQTVGLAFTHRLQRGPSESRTALALLRLHGAPESMVTRAMTTAALLDRQRAVNLIREP